MSTKVCIDCQQEFPKTYEYFRRANRTGYNCRCKSCDKIKSHEYYLANIDRCKEYYRNYRSRLKDKVMEHYGGVPPKCACPGCGECRIEFLTIDHINGNGREHRRADGTGMGTPFYAWLVKNNFPDGFRVLCYNCNCSRGHAGYCPHEREARAVLHR